MTIDKISLNVAFDPFEGGGCPQCEWSDSNVGRTLERPCAIHQKIDEIHLDMAMERGVANAQAQIIRDMVAALGGDEEDNPVELAKERMDEHKAWRDDPTSDERWNAGLDYGQTQLCNLLGVDPDKVNWDAATETLDGDVQAVIGNILTAAYGDDHWQRPSKLDSIEPEAGGLHTVALIFQNGTPTVNKGDCRVFCALMVSRHTGKDLVLPLYYLNQMPLEKEDCDCAEEHDEGCPTTGWFYDNSNFDYDNCYWSAEGEVVAWAELPKAEVVRSAFTRRASPAPVAVPAGYRLVPDAARHAKSLREVAAVLSTERIQGWANPLVALLTDVAEAIAPQPLPANAGQWVLAASPVPSTATQAGAVTRAGNETDGGAE